MNSLNVPWQVTGKGESPRRRHWRWETEHFVADIDSPDDKTFIYRVEDMMQYGKPYVLQHAIAVSLQEAQDNILELVGKAYPLGTPYRDYAGPLATTFKIANGKKIDFGEYEGHRVQLKVRREGTEEAYVGALRVVNHKLRLDRGGSGNGRTLEISPELVLSVQELGGSRKDEGRDEIKTFRTVPGHVTVGCTGRPGFDIGWVDHQRSSPWCPIHRV